MVRRLLPRYSDWLLLAFGLLIVGLITGLTAAGPTSRRLPLSTSSPQQNGALAAYRWLNALGYRVENVQSLEPALLAPKRTTLLFLQPQRRLGRSRVIRLLHWIRRGGRVVATTTFSSRWLLARVGATSRSTPPASIRIVEPLVGRPPVSRIEVRADSTVGMRRGVVVARSRYGDVLVRLALGHGVLWLLAAPNALENAKIDRPGNRALLLSLVGRRGRLAAFVDLTNPPSNPRGPDGWLGMPWGIAALFGVAVALAYRWLGGWRLGPATPTVDESARPASDYVVALAGLLRKGRKRAVVLNLYQEHLKHLLRSRSVHLEPDPRLFETPGRLSDDELIARCTEIVDLERDAAGSAYAVSSGSTGTSVRERTEAG